MRTKTVSRPLAVLKLPVYHVPQLVTYARSIVRAMTNNPVFPAPVPQLATVEAAIDALAAAETATLSGMDGTVAVRDARRLALKMVLEQLRGHVQATADADSERAASIIESAGMAVKKSAGPPPGPRVFAAKWGPVSGSVKLIAPKAANRAGYEWAFSTDGKATWTSLPFTVQASTTVVGLERGSTVYFRYRTATKEGTGDWSDPVSLIVE
jgi:hypothetical protein